MQVRRFKLELKYQLGLGLLSFLPTISAIGALHISLHYFAKAFIRINDLIIK